MREKRREEKERTNERTKGNEADATLAALPKIYSTLLYPTYRKKRNSNIPRILSVDPKKVVRPVLKELLGQYQVRIINARAELLESQQKEQDARDAVAEAEEEKTALQVNTSAWRPDPDSLSSALVLTPMYHIPPTLSLFIFVFIYSRHIHIYSIPLLPSPHPNLPGARAQGRGDAATGEGARREAGTATQ